QADRLIAVRLQEIDTISRRGRDGRRVGDVEADCDIRLLCVIDLEPRLEPQPLALLEEKGLVDELDVVGVVVGIVGGERKHAPISIVDSRNLAAVTTAIDYGNGPRATRRDERVKVIEEDVSLRRVRRNVRPQSRIYLGVGNAIG